MNFIFEFIGWWSGIHMVDWFWIVFPILLIASVTGLSEFGAKQLLCIIGYTVILNFIGILLGFAPYFWWAWGWNFAFIPVLNWWKPMLLIFTIAFISIIVAYNNGYNKEMDEHLLTGFGAPMGCTNWPCTKFSPHTTYSGRVAAEKEEKAAEAARKAAPPVIPSYLPSLMFVPVK